MSTATKSRKLDARLDVRLPRWNKDLIEEAASLTGQSVSDYVVFTLVQHSGDVLEQRRNIRLSNRDRDRFLRMLETDREPNSALRRGARRFKRFSKSGL